MKIRKFLNMKNILVSFYASIAFCMLYFAFLEAYLQPVIKIKEITAIIAPNVLCFIVISIFTYVITKRL